MRRIVGWLLIGEVIGGLVALAWLRPIIKPGTALIAGFTSNGLPMEPVFFYGGFLAAAAVALGAALLDRDLWE